MARSARAPAVALARGARAGTRRPATAPALDARLLELAARLAPVSVLPVGSAAMAAADRLRDALARRACGSRCRRAEAFATASARTCTAARARTLGHRHAARARGRRAPRGARGAGASSARRWCSSRAARRAVKALRYVRDADELEAAFEAVRAAASEGVLAQEYVRGDGLRVQRALLERAARARASCTAACASGRRRGGTSAAAESVPECPPLERAGTALLDALGWHGVAMVEFKGDPDGRLALIEINAKFWGSHDVALAAGVRLPERPGGAARGPRRCRRSRRCRAVRFSVAARRRSVARAVRARRRCPRVLWDALSPGVAHSFRWRDPLPHALRAGAVGALDARRAGASAGSCDELDVRRSRAHAPLARLHDRARRRWCARAVSARHRRARGHRPRHLAGLGRRAGRGVDRPERRCAS